MKYLFVLFSIAILTKSCNDSNTEKETVTNAQDDISIQFEAYSRGFYQKINITKERFSLTKVRNGEVSIQQEMSVEDWNEIVKLLDKIDSEKLKKNYVNPDDLARDAVIPANLVISYKENVVKNVEFGLGNEPKPLKALITKIEAMANAVDKP